VAKTKCQVFRRGGRLAARECWFYRGSRIDVVNRFKYLGVWFTSTRSWTYHVETAADKAKRVIFLLKKFTYGSGGLPLLFLWHLYDTLAAPVVLYGSEIYGCSIKHTALDRVEAKFARSALRLPQSAPYSGIVLETKRYMSIYWKAKMRVFRYWTRILQLPKSRLVYKAYEVQRHLAANNVRSWGSCLKEDLAMMGVGGLWRTELVGTRWKDIHEEIAQGYETRAYFEAMIEAMEKPSLRYYLERRTGLREETNCLELPPEERRWIIMSRLNVSCFRERINVQGEMVWRCSVCAGIEHGNIWTHILWHCQNLKELRTRFRMSILSDTRDQSLVFDAPGEDLRNVAQYLQAVAKKLKVVRP